MHLFNLLPLLTSAASLSIKSPQGQGQIPIGAPGKEYAIQTPPLDTPWTYEVGTNPWPQYPRPKLARSQWQSLNGIWTYSNASGFDALDTPPFNKTLSQEVLVPFCLESGLSGIQNLDTIYSWYRTTFTVPKSWTGDRVLLNFGAVDYEATVFVNGHRATFNRGGYFSFSVDVTDYLKDGQNELIVFAFDPTDSDGYIIPVGKQSLRPSHIWYRSCSGIWQSVWIESAPKDHIAELHIDGDAAGQVSLTVYAVGGSRSNVNVTVFERGTTKAVATHSGIAGAPMIFSVKSPKKWSTSSPNLYDVSIKMGKDEVKSYTGFRTVTSKEVDGAMRIVLNGEVIFPFGTLDQGYWPDGLYTPPTYEAMTFDIKTLKKLGYNMLRKHVKVESALYYAAADELGILIMQDMPCLKPDHEPSELQQVEFQRQMKLLVMQLKSYSSIFAWVIYNEGWGQRPSYSSEFAIAEIVRLIDPTRLVNAVSGWHDHGAGDFHDNHHYTDPQCGVPWYITDTRTVKSRHGRSHTTSTNTVMMAPHDPSRIGFQGEFGGAGHNVSENHLWKVSDAINAIDQTYELWATLDAWNLRGRYLLRQMLTQVEMFSCAGGVWTQTTDVEGEVNGMLTYDRRILRADVKQWNADIQALYDASERRCKAVVAVDDAAMGQAQAVMDIQGNEEL